MKKEESLPSSEKPPFVVGIGASAGGLESVSTLLKHLPADTGMSFVVMQHMSKGQTSLLPTLLGRVTKMPVHSITHTLRVQPNCVYVLPPGHDVELKEKKFHLMLREARAAMDGQIDKFMLSLADHGREQAIGIILSGTGSDGTRGLTVIKEKGGRTFVEAESSAKFFGMPQSAIAAGVVDQVLTPINLARKLARLSREQAYQVKSAAPAPDDTLADIFEILRAEKHVDFTNYKHSTIRRRLQRRMVLRKITRLADYAKVLARDAGEMHALFNDLLINVTGFFRNKPVFTTLCKQVLAPLIAEKKNGDDLRIWIPGCATGEEVYSIGICVAEAMARAKKKLNVQIFGTDLSESAVRRARTGIYPAEAVREISAERLRRHFVRKNKTWQIGRHIRDCCTFAQQNLCADPPFSRLDLISCRNVLIYFDAALQRKCVPTFFYALNDHGYLLLGNSETIGSFANLFSLMDKKNKIYRKKVAPASPGEPVKKFRTHAASILPASPPVRPEPKNARTKAGRDAAEDIQTAADRLILTHFAPCGVVVDPKFQVWHFRGNTAPFLQHSPGAASLNILRMVHHDLSADLSAAIHQALKSGSGVRKEGMILEMKNGPRDVQLEVIPFNVRSSSEQWLLVIFECRPAAAAAVLHGKARRSHSENNYAREVTRLRTELASTKDSLQAIIEEQEAANEEIKSANEEIESSNEELQSTNEELETAKEELQSTNEELTTVNDELNNRNHEISDINNDLNNLLSNIHLAIVLVDNALIIRRTTPLAEKLFNIIPSDLGRKLSDINPNLKMPELPALIHRVIDQLVPVEQTVTDRDGHSYSLRVRPYRTRDNVINGAVILLVDVPDPKKISGEPK